MEPSTFHPSVLKWAADRDRRPAVVHLASLVRAARRLDRQIQAHLAKHSPSAALLRELAVVQSILQTYSGLIETAGTDELVTAGEAA